MGMSSLNDQLNEQFAVYVEENAKFAEKSNKAAGTRARKALMEITKLCKGRRKEIQDIKNSA